MDDNIIMGKIEMNFYDKSEVMAALKGMDYFMCICDMSDYLRKEYKYAEHTEEEYKLLDKIRDEFFRILDSRNVTTDDIN